jgi:hypothetical protein
MRELFRFFCLVFFSKLDELQDIMDAFIEILLDLMLPDSKNMPAMCKISAGNEIIPLRIAIYFLRPVILIALGEMAVPGTIMPEAGVNKDDNLVFSNRDIRCAH